ncbi:hypothetical protein Rhe02_92690 [Rhizocola hellebori]|uniref:PH domain-containing protein n=1 Tax=Rhizocola hellebori TaxID=1392758 RepID=A0A8J3VM10_9ACTN|nr:hypothetical protein [Rhizocola hellebori]GIH11202.1 hypothetical protein Rhe02_92690 [Rhizocola hellebori]
MLWKLFDLGRDNGSVHDFRPLPVTRAACAVPGAMLIVLAPVIALTGWEGAILGLVSACGGVVLAVRGYRMGVTVQPDVVIVRGFLWNRTIPRRSLVEIADYPALIWRAESGRMRWTPLTAFMSDGSTLGRYRSHSETSLARLARTLKIG